MEDYKRKFDQLLGVVKEFYPSMNDYQKEKFEGVCLELVESEDEKIRNGLLKLLKELVELGGVAGDTWSLKECQQYIAWLEKQKPVEWSEEDEKMLQFAIDDFQFCVDNKQFPVVYNTETHENVLNWLKHLKPKNRWKPSEEQMEALWDIIPHLPNCKEDVNKITILSTLYEELKKL